MNFSKIKFLKQLMIFHRCRKVAVYYNALFPVPKLPDLIINLNQMKMCFKRARIRNQLISVATETNTLEDLKQKLEKFIIF